MLTKQTIVMLFICCHFSISFAGKIADKIKARKVAARSSRKQSDNPAPATGKYEDQKVSKAAKLTDKQVEFTKKFFKNLMEDQKKGEKGIPVVEPKGMKFTKSDLVTPATSLDEELAITKDAKRKKRSPPNQSSPGGVGQYKSVPSGGTIFFDSILHNFFPVGDPYSGAPDGILSMGKWCIEIFVKGAIGVIYAIIRWPHKIFSKMILVVSAVAFVPNTLMWCLNPASIAHFIGKSKIINKNMDELAEITYKKKVRIANTIDKIHTTKDMQKHSCCAYMDWRDEMIKTVDDDAKEFLSRWFNSFFKLHQILYCGDYQDGTEECNNVEWIDDEPLRVVPRSMITLWMELFAKFF